MTPVPSVTRSFLAHRFVLEIAEARDKTGGRLIGSSSYESVSIARRSCALSICEPGPGSKCRKTRWFSAFVSSNVSGTPLALKRAGCQGARAFGVTRTKTAHGSIRTQGVADVSPAVHLLRPGRPWLRALDRPRRSRPGAPDASEPARGGRKCRRCALHCGAGAVCLSHCASAEADRPDDVVAVCLDGIDAGARHPL